MRLLCVDDEPNIVSALRRALRGCGAEVATAASGQEGLEVMRLAPADVVVSDMRMPGMSGVEFLEQVREHWPDSVRILLTGHAEMGETVGAINRGRIFRYLSKPWSDAELVAAVQQGLELVSLQRDKARLEDLTLAQNLQLRALNESLEQRVQERTEELAHANRKLKRTYLTTIKVFSNLLEMRGGTLVGHGRRVADLARSVARAMSLGEQEIDDIFVAGLLHDIGHIGLPDALLAKPVARLTTAEMEQYAQHPTLAEQLLMPLEDMQGAAALICAHHERFDGRGYPLAKAGTAIPLGARILAIVDTYDELRNGHLGGAQPSSQQALVLLQQGRGTQFDPEVVETLVQLLTMEEKEPARKSAKLLSSDELEAGMVLDTDLISPMGMLLLAAGQRLTTSLIQRIRAFERDADQRFRIQVRSGRSQ